MTTPPDPALEKRAKDLVLEWDGIERAAGGSTTMSWEDQLARLMGRIAAALAAAQRETRDRLLDEFSEAMVRLEPRLRPQRQVYPFFDALEGFSKALLSSIRGPADTPDAEPPESARTRAIARACLEGDHRP